MNAEQIEKLIEVLEVGRDAAHEVAQRFHDEMKGYREAEHKQVDKDVADLNEAIAMLEAERATQPAQDLTAAQQENADFHQWWESSGQKADHDLRTENAAHAAWQERASRNEDGENDYLIDRLGKLLAGVAVALNGPEPALTRWSYHDLPEKATKLMLELEIYRATAPAKDQVAAVRAVPEGYVIAPHYRGYAHLGLGQYLINHSRAGDDAELAISIATDAQKAGRFVGDLRDNDPGEQVIPEDITVRLRFENVAGLDALEQQLRLLREVHFAAPSPQPELNGSIDDPEFREKLQAHLLQYQRTMGLQGDKRAEFIAHIDAWKDAACALAREEGYAKNVSNTECGALAMLEIEMKRATDAEAKLAAIQSQAAGDALLEAVRSVLREGLDSANVHPCDSNNDDARARQLSPLMQNLYRAAMREQQP